ncbi:hypothetical protein VNO80_20770 [Phaseolus coccineus]|uniref:Secreted protein n=1 Tax=Phaseolus coccineus TaxID=3886 RepID=A0AAN9M159_PHACN
MVATLPVIKVLLITARGLFIGLDGISILGDDARKTVNQVTCANYTMPGKKKHFSFAENDALSVTACVLCVQSLPGAHGTGTATTTTTTTAFASDLSPFEISLWS